MSHLIIHSDIKRRAVTIGLVFLVLIFLVFGKSLVFSALHVIQRPFVNSGTWLAIKYEKIISPFTVKQDDIDKLNSTISQLALDQVKFYALIQENADLRNELGFVKRSNYNSVPASIISRTSSMQKSTFGIDVGGEQGVVLGAAVIIQNGIYIGKITKVSKTQSVVTTATDKENATAVSLLNKTKTIGIAEGKSGNLLELKFIPADEEISVNDLVVTSGLEEKVPAGLLVGIINTVRPDPEAPFQEAILEPLVDIRKHNHVIVLLPK